MLEAEPLVDLVRVLRLGAELGGGGASVSGDDGDARDDAAQGNRSDEAHLWGEGGGLSAKLSCLRVPRWPAASGTGTSGGAACSEEEEGLGAPSVSFLRRYAFLDDDVALQRSKNLFYFFEISV